MTTDRIALLKSRHECLQLRRKLEAKRYKSQTRPLVPGTVPYMLMETAKKLLQPFAAADLVFWAYAYYPDDFCLAGYPQYPDSNKVIVYLSGPRGLVGRGLLERVAANLYRVKE